MKKYGNSSIKSKILVPLTAILLVQAAILFALVICGGVAGRLRNNAIDILNENADNSRLLMERQIVHHWIRDIHTTNAIRQSVEEILTSNGKQAKDIGSDPELNREIVYAAMPSLINVLHRSYGNGIYMILDGPAAVHSGTGTQAGVYIRDLDPRNYADDNSDLLLERGLPSISKEFGIALDSNWELGFTLDRVPANDYFYKPFDEVKDQKISIKNVTDYGYLGSLMQLDPMDVKVLTYSIPLTLADGTTIGVIGGDITEAQLRSLLNQDSERQETVLKVLGRREKGSSLILPVVASSPVFDTCFDKNAVLLCEAAEGGTVSRIEDKRGAVWYAGVKSMDIYNNNTPFETEEWVVMRLRQENELFAFYTEVSRILSISLMISVVFGLAAVLLVGNIVTNPIMKLVQELRITGRRERIRLNRTRIDEVDELIDAIEGLSADVAAAASRISNVLEASGIPLGVYELVNDMNKVFCSRTLFDLVELPAPEEDYCYLELDEFRAVMEKLTREEERKDSKLYSVSARDKKRWLHLEQVVEENGDVIGVLTDVTADVLERKKLERDRNFDLLTGIYNRRAFREIVEEMLHEAGEKPMAFVMWDLDNLKYVNDTYGHEEGDRYIRKFADYLRTLEKHGAVVERHSGDEFMAVLNCGTKEEQFDHIRDFMELMKQITLEQEDGYRLPLRASAGIAWYPEHGTDFDTLVRFSDFAMYMAKHSTKGILQEFDPVTYQTNSYLLSGNEELNHLLEERKVDYAFQPIVTREGTVYGYEALMRPRMVHLKNVQEVLHLARTQAKLSQVEELTWLTALGWFDRFKREGRLEAEARFFINSISSTCLSQDTVAMLERRYPDCLSHVVLEVTESEPKEESMKDKLETMKRWNAMIAIDDFGSGYNSESILLKLHPDIVKLDMELVRHIDEDKDRQNMLKSLIPLCHRQDILVAAEGVETFEELKILYEMEVDLFQGYYLCRPELEVRPLNPYIVEKLQELAKNRTGNCEKTMI